MRVLYQGVQLGDVNAARFTWGRQAVLGADRLVNGFSHVADFGEIAFAVNGQADCQARMAAIETAFSLPYGDLLVQNDDNSNSVNSVLSAATVDGVRPMRLQWDDRPGAQFHTWRSYNAAFEWETRLAGLPANRLVDFTESVQVQGGTPRQVVNSPINVLTTAADEFITIPRQKFVVTQSGRAVGLTQYPNLDQIAPYVIAGGPMVLFTGGGGNGAAGFATGVAGVVTAVTVTNAGTGYTSAPTVSFIGSNGTGATATAATGGGGVTGVTVLTGGTGYLLREPSDRSIRRTAPQKAGSTHQNFAIEYSYTWELGVLAVLPMPNLWI